MKWLQDSDWQKLLPDTPAVTSAEGCLWCWSNIASQPLVPGRVKRLRVAVKSVVLLWCQDENGCIGDWCTRSRWDACWESFITPGSLTQWGRCLKIDTCSSLFIMFFNIALSCFCFPPVKYCRSACSGLQDSWQACRAVCTRCIRLIHWGLIRSEKYCQAACSGWHLVAFAAWKLLASPFPT